MHLYGKDFTNIYNLNDIKDLENNGVYVNNIIKYMISVCTTTSVLKYKKFLESAVSLYGTYNILPDTYISNDFKDVLNLRCIGIRFSNEILNTLIYNASKLITVDQL
jgi:hypothetical protein